MFCDLQEALHALGIECCIRCVLCAEAVHPINEVTDIDVFNILQQVRCRPMIEVAIMLAVLGVLLRVLGFVSEPLFHQMIVGRGWVIFEGIVQRTEVELVVGKIAMSCFPSVVDARGLVEQAPGVNGKKPVINDVAVPWMKAVEEFSIPHFIRKLVGEAERVDNLEETPVIEQELIFISDAHLS